MSELGSTKVEYDENTLSKSISNELPDFIDVIKTGNLREAAAAMLKEYCDFSTIHGVRYLGERKRHWIEKIFWLIIFTLSIFICYTLVAKAWNKWNSTPVLINFADKSTPIWKIPLPTFTVCPDNKINSQIFNFTAFYEKAEYNVSGIDEWSQDEKYFLDIALQVCHHSNENFLEQYFSINFNDSVYDILEKLTPSMENILEYFEFDGNGTQFECDKFVDVIVTELGICFSFNMIPLDMIYRKDVANQNFIVKSSIYRNTKWSLSNGYEGLAVHEKFPYRTYSTNTDLSVKAFYNGIIDDIDSTCSGGDDGFKFAISTPGDIPQLSRQYFSIPFNNEVMVEIKPELQTTADTAASYSPEIRNCFYENEKYLKYFKIYSKPNCEFECLTNYTLKKCDCVRFNMPRMKSTEICGAHKITCYLNAKRELMEYGFQNIVNESYKIPDVDCNCLPTCTSLTYSVSVTQAPLSSAVIEEGNFISTFKVYFKDSRFWSLERSKIYGPIEFISDVGGLLGLFMGVSLLSCVEIFYFITVRFCGHIKLRYFTKTIQIIQRRVSDAYVDMQNIQIHFGNKNCNE